MFLFLSQFVRNLCDMFLLITLPGIYYLLVWTLQIRNKCQEFLQDLCFLCESSYLRGGSFPDSRHVFVLSSPLSPKFSCAAGVFQMGMWIFQSEWFVYEYDSRRKLFTKHGSWGFPKILKIWSQLVERCSKWRRCRHFSWVLVIKHPEVLDKWWSAADS